MRKMIFLLMLFLNFHFLSNAQNNCYELVWNDEFNYSGLPDTTKWYFESGGDGWGNNELQYYTENRLENARVENGNLVIEAREESFGTRNYTSARLITYHADHSWKYGKIEARMKLPYGQGIWPAIWMLGDKLFEGTRWPASGEIDIMEMVGGGAGKDNTIHGTIHWADANNNHASYGGKTTLDEGIFADTFHVFGMEWDENSIRWFLDGIQYHMIDITPAALSEFHDQFFLILNLAVGGNWPGSPNSFTVFPQTLMVDYIRVYQRNKSPKIIGPEKVVPSQANNRFSTVESEDFSYTWYLPDGTELVAGQGTHEAIVNWSCQPDTIACEIIANCDTHLITFPVNLADIELQGKERVSLNEERLEYSLPLMTNTTYAWYYSLEDTMMHIDTNIITLDWGNQDGYIKVFYENGCGIDSIQKAVSLVSQLPYPDENLPHVIPGTVEAANYDAGGEGISYHDTDDRNEGPGPRQDEAVDTEVYNGISNVGWTHAGEWLEYAIQVEHDTTYTLEALTASETNRGVFQLLVNDEDRTGNIQVPSTGSWSLFRSLVVENLRLYTTDTLLRVSIIEGDFNLRQLTFQISTPSSTQVSMDDKNEIIIYPTFVTDWLHVKNVPVNSFYSILSTGGKRTKSGMVQEGLISVSDLKKGLYILYIQQSGNIHVSKFIKQ